MKGVFPTRNFIACHLRPQEKLSSQWAVGGRIGGLVFPQLLTYFSGGYTEAHLAVNPSDPRWSSLRHCLGFFTARPASGCFLGAGDEYALSFLPGLFWKTEYRFSAWTP